MPEESDSGDWTKGLVSKAPLSPSAAREKAGTSNQSSVSSTKTYSDGSESTRKAQEIAKQYKWRKSEVKPVEKVDSTLLKEGWARGTYVGLGGSPGGGKSRLCLQEAFAASKRGEPVLYMYNEFIQNKYDQFIDKALEELGYNEDDISNISWVDMCRYDMAVADFDGMKSFFKRRWLSQVTYWLEHLDGTPSFIFIDSFSAITRRFIPQMWQGHAILLDLIASEIELLDKKPVIFIVHQKSGSSREKNDDSAVGGYGVVHELDTVVIMGKYDVDVWAAKRYGWPEGTVQRTIHSPKDRYGSELDEQRVMVMNNGKLTLGSKISELVLAQEKAQQGREEEKAARYKSRSSSSEGEAVGPDEVWST
jgi:hypothetical protein